MNIASTFIAALLLSCAGIGCYAAEPEADDVETKTSELQSAPGGTTTTSPGYADPTYYPPPVRLPAYWGAGDRTATTVRLGWNELGDPQNPQTKIYRQRYDLDGRKVGGLTLIKTFKNLPAGPHSFVDSKATTDDGSGPETDRMSCYVLQETTGTCEYTQGGYTCVSTKEACAYTRSATRHPVARVQLRIRTASVAGAGAPNNHVQVRLQSPYMPYAPSLPIPRGNDTWLDSYKADFVEGSDLYYDLKTTNIRDLSDITQIAIITPESDSLCVSDIELRVDNTRAFFKSFGTSGVCAANGTAITATFGDLRRSATWQGFNPPNLSPDSSKYASFVGYRAQELISVLDMAFGDTLRDPANGLGDDAGFLRYHATTTTRIDQRHLRVSQHILARDAGWQGSVRADPTYDLVIHNDTATCGGKHWCVTVETVDANSDYSGWIDFIPVVGQLVALGIDSIANGQMQAAMTSMGGNALNDPPSGFEYCFPGRVNDTPFGSLGFDAGSLTLCFAN